MGNAGWKLLTTVALAMLSGGAMTAENRLVALPSARHLCPDRRYVGIPSVERSSVNGRLWCAWYASASGEEDSNTYVVLATSTDEGKTWKELLAVDPDGEGPFRSFDPELWIAPDGKLRFFWSEQVAPLALKSVIVPAKGIGLGDPKSNRLWMLTLSAEDEPTVADIPPPKCITSGVMMAKPSVIPGGVWGLPVARWEGDRSSELWVSEDGGRTFVCRGGACVPKKYRDYDEVNLFARKDGVLEMWARANHGFIWRTSSTDGGRTWSSYAQSRIAHTNSRFCVRRLPSGALLLVKHGAIDKDVGRKDMTAFVSDDDGETWTGGLMIEERAGATYPDATVSPDGTIRLVQDNNRKTAREILYSRFTERDVRAGRLVDSGSFLRRLVSSPYAKTPRLRVGILSDIHVRLSPDSAKEFGKALEYFDSRKADAVVVAGDLTETGLVPELANVAAEWNRVFPDNRAKDGRRVEKLFVWGNHDVNAWEWGEPESAKKYEKYDKIKTDFAAAWRRAFGEDYASLWIRDVKGYKFVGCQLQRYPKSGPDADFLARHRPELAGERPFFYVQHEPPKGTCPWYPDCEDDGASARALTPFGNAMAITGHSHVPLNDERTLWQEAFTAVSAGSLESICPYGGRENSFVVGATDPEGARMQMPAVWIGTYRQGQFMLVYDDCIVLERRDFANGLPLANDWVIPLPFDGSMGHARRRERTVVPQFFPDDKVTVSDVRGKDRSGKETDQLVVSFPNVLSDHGGRAFDYTVAVEVRTQDSTLVHLTKAVYSPRFCFAEEKDEETVTCVFSREELPKPLKKWGKALPAPAGRSYRFAVRPRNCFGEEGSPIYSQWMQ